MPPYYVSKIMQEDENCTHSWGNNAKITLLFKSNGSP